MSKLTESARGQPCQIRVPSYCSGNPETVVACHYRLAGTCGVGMKPPDFLIAFGCAACHDCVDGRIRTNYTRDELRLMHCEGVMRTQILLHKAGLLSEGKRGIAQ
jgi:hypothetical protein